MRKNLDLYMNKPTTKIVILTLTDNCNLDCTYCYEHNKQPHIMGFSTAKRIIDYEMNVDDGTNFICIYYFGGEPFLEFETIKKIHSYLQNHVWSKGWFAFITTNGTLVHDEIRYWLQTNSDSVEAYISLDGTREMHNCNRSNSYDSIDTAFFVKEYPFAKMTVTKDTLQHLAKGVIALHEKGFEVSANLGCGIEWNENSPQILAQQLKILSDYYIEHPNLKVATILNLALMDMEPGAKHPKRFCGVGPNMKSYDTDGRLFPCHAFAPLCIGKELAEQSQRIDFSKPVELSDLDEKCQTCPVVGVCPTCYGINFGKYHNPYHVDDTHCRMMKVQFLANAKFKYRQYISGRLSLTEEEELRLLSHIMDIQTMLGENVYD